MANVHENDDTRTGRPGAHGPELSVVVPVFNEQENIPQLHRRLTDALRGKVESYELVLVDDGSRDATPGMLDDIQAGDPCVVVLHFSRNFGHQAAVSAGIEHARGRAVAIIDGDLQDPPEVILDFVEAWRKGADVAYAIRTDRKEGAAKRAGYFVFYRILRAISDIEIPLDSGDFCLMDRRVVDALCALPERMRFIRGLRSFVGFEQRGVAYERAARAAGEPKYTFRKLVGLAVDGLVSFSGYPLKLAMYLGFLAAFVAILLAVWVFVDAMHQSGTPRGWASTIVVVLFMGATQLTCMGILGEYVRRIFIETKGRPTYILRDVRGSRSDDPRAQPSARGS